MPALSCPLLPRGLLLLKGALPRWSQACMPLGSWKRPRAPPQQMSISRASTVLFVVWNELGTFQVRRIKALCQRTDGSGCPSGASSPKYRLLAPGPELTPALPCSLLPRLYRAEGSVTEEGRSFHQTLRGGFPQFSFQEQKKIFFFQQKYTQPHISRLSISCIKLGFYPEQTGPCRTYSTCREAAWQHVLK